MLFSLFTGLKRFFCRVEIRMYLFKNYVNCDAFIWIYFEFFSIISCLFLQFEAVLCNWHKDFNLRTDITDINIRASQLYNTHSLDNSDQHKNQIKKGIRKNIQQFF